MMVGMCRSGRRACRYAAPVLLVAASYLAACTGSRPSSPPAPDTANSSPASTPATSAAPGVADELRRLLDEEPARAEDAFGRAIREDARRFYSAAGFRAMWTTDDGQPTSDAAEAAALFAEAGLDGLSSADYATDQPQAIATALNVAVHTPPVRARFDVGMTTAVLRYFRHVHVGRVDPESSGFRMIKPDNQHDFVAALESALEGHRVRRAAAELAPPFQLYQRLRDALARYRALATEAPAPFRLTGLPKIEPGQEFDGAPALAHRLSLLGDMDADEDAPVATASSGGALYDESLAEGVRRFQRRHGLTPDGVIGKSTMAALNVPLADRVRQIEFALERLRWLPHIGPGRFIAVNIPMFRLWAWDDVRSGGAPAFVSDVIVGRAPGTRTPVLASALTHLVLRPYWNVPASIARGELIPAWRKDSSYFDAHNLEIVAGQTDDATPVPATADAVAELERGRLRLRQRPGPDNSLGLVKFIFPNEENVYLHATPATQLFGRSRRDFSHGCVRVENPVGLAEWLLAGDAEWNRSRITAAMQGARPLSVNVSPPVQVVLFYITAAVMPEDGTLAFAEDIYGHDALLAQALDRRAASGGLVRP